jgi:hypothetical protein
MYGSTPLPDALGLRMSIGRAFFDSQVYKQHTKNEEAERGIQLAIVDRLNGVIAAIGKLGKALGR